MAIIPFGQPDRGIVLFAGPPAAPDNDGQRILRLMGVVCSVSECIPSVRQDLTRNQTVPFPTFNRGPPAQPQQNVPQPVIPQPKVIHPPQQQIQPVSVNGMPSYQTMPPQSGMQPLSAGMNQMYQAQQQQNYQQAQPIPQPRQLQPPFQQMQQQLVVQPQVRPHLNSGIPERISPEGIQAIMEAARRNHVNLPPGFDPNSLPRDKLANVLRVIQTAEARNKQQQQEQFQQAQQQPQSMGQTYGQQMRPGQGQFMQ
jgi:hypothetical protein